MAARYTTDAEVERVLPDYLRLQMFDDDHNGVEDVGVCEMVREDADDLVDGYIQAAGYLVPVDGTVPTFIRRSALAIFRYLAHERIGADDEKVERAYERTLEQLDKFVRGEIKIGLDPVPSPSSTAAKITLTSQTLVLGRSNLSGL